MTARMNETIGSVAPVDGWSAEVLAAQIHTAYNIGGRAMSRVVYGEAGDDRAADFQPCEDCGALKGQLHVPGCELERCPACGGAVIGCDCDYGR